MSIEEWKKGDTITSDKMNRIVDALNTTEKAVHETNNRVDNIVENLAKVTTVSDTVKAKEADLCPHVPGQAAAARPLPVHGRIPDAA